MDKSGATAVKTDNAEKAGKVVLLTSVKGLDIQPGVKAETVKKVETISKAETKTDSAAKMETPTKPKATAVQDKKTETISKSETKAEPTKKAAAVSKPETKKKTEAISKTETKTDSAAKAETVSKSETKAESAKKGEAISRTETKTDSATKTGTAAKTKATAVQDKKTETVSESETKAEPTKKTEAISKSETKTETKTDSATKTGTAAKPKATAVQNDKTESAMRPPQASPVQNPPVSAADSPLKKMKQEFTERTNVIRQEMHNIQNSFLVIGFQLHWIKSNNMYRVLDYKNIMDYAEKEFGIKKSTCCNFINIIENYAERDANGEVIESIADCYRNFTSSQLVAMLGMPEEMQHQVTPDMSVRAIQRLRKGETEMPPADAAKAVSTDIKEQARPAADKPTVAAESEQPASKIGPAPAAQRPEESSPVAGSSMPPAEKAKESKAANTAKVPEQATPERHVATKEPVELAEIDSYSDYQSMLDELDLIMKHVFSAENSVRVKIVCVQG